MFMSDQALMFILKYHHNKTCYTRCPKKKYIPILVLATCRDPLAPKSAGLIDLQQEYGGENGRLKIRQLDAANSEQVAELGKMVSNVNV